MGQSLSRIHLHAIFSTKSREPVLHESWRDELFRVIGGAVNNCGCQSLIVGGVADHVHILFELSRTLTVASATETPRRRHGDATETPRRRSSHPRLPG